MGCRNVTQAVRNWQARNRARQELQRLSDRDLADIGVTRRTIDAAVRGEIQRPHRPGLYTAR